MTTIKNKTELRETIINSLGTTGQWDNIQFYNDGTWDVTNQNSWSPEAVFHSRIEMFVSETGPYMSREICNMSDTVKRLNKLITANFKWHEDMLNAAIDN